MAARRASSVIDRSPASRSSRSCVSNAGAMTVRCTVIGSRADRRRSTRWYISTGTPRAAEGGPTRGVDPREAGPAPTASAAAQATATALRTRSAGPKPAHRPVDRIEHGPDHGLPGIVVDDGRAAEQLLFRSRPGDDGNRDPVQAERGDGGQRKAKDAVRSADPSTWICSIRPSAPRSTRVAETPRMRRITPSASWATDRCSPPPITNLSVFRLDQSVAAIGAPIDDVDFEGLGVAEHEE